MLKFFWNGIKSSEDGSKLQKAHYSDSALIKHPAGTITIYARDYVAFSAEVKREFAVQNDSDIMTDYIQKDHIRVTPDHPLYAQVSAALAKCREHYAKK